ncbi:LPXTG cell wall anchor domain-containing protein [Streptococcus cristatus]|uniref:LPXTG cell wall anchor domain-containing protein n=1 Tax=Streptococcus cristatus TaxID=45634 RepID=UPI001F17A7BD|nr:LPXTG cell wall anchor domain-containing protein [Streptococcus cristatus]
MSTSALQQSNSFSYSKGEPTSESKPEFNLPSYLESVSASESVSTSTSMSDSASTSASLSDSASISSATNHSQAPKPQPAQPGQVKVTPNAKALPNTGTASNQFAGLGLGVAALVTASLLGKKKRSAASEMDLED